MDMDQTTFTEIATIVQGRNLNPHVTDLLTRYVAGAIRPNRDQPVFDLCKQLVKLGDELRSGGCAPEAIADECLAAVLDPTQSGQHSPKSLALLSFGEFLLVHQDCEYFSEMRDIIQSLSRSSETKEIQSQIKTSVSTISKKLYALRIERFPIARHERTFQSIYAYLFARSDHAHLQLNFADEDILGYWSGRIGPDDHVMFQTVVKQFVIFHKVGAQGRQQSAINQASDLENVLFLLEDGPQAGTESLISTSEEDGDRDRFEIVIDFLNSDRPVGLKALTSRERERLLAVFDCGQLMQTCPLTVLRRLSFGRVQSGISNYLRRSGGGSSLESRLRCDDAAGYVSLKGGYHKLGEHGQRLMAILAYALKASKSDMAATFKTDDFNEVAQRGRAELSKMSRRGFDQPVADIAASLLPVAGELAKLNEVLEAFVAAIERRGQRDDLDCIFERDREVFSKCFTVAYSPGIHIAAEATKHDH